MRFSIPQVTVYCYRDYPSGPLYLGVWVGERNIEAML